MSNIEHPENKIKKVTFYNLKYNNVGNLSYLKG